MSFLFVDSLVNGDAKCSANLILLCLNEQYSDVSMIARFLYVFFSQYNLWCTFNFFLDLFIFDWTM